MFSLREVNHNESLRVDPDGGRNVHSISVNMSESPPSAHAGVGTGGFFNPPPKLNIDDLIMNTKIVSPKASPYASEASSEEESESMSMSQYSQSRKERPSFFQKPSDSRSVNDEDYDDEDDEYETHTQVQPPNNMGFQKPTPMQNSFFQQQEYVPRVDNTQRKRELLYQFDRMEKKGVPLPRKFTMSDTLEEIEQEYDRLKKEREVDASIKFQRKVLTAFVSGVECLNAKFDPFNITLDGWSESISENINDYDEIFEDLHDKYKTKSKLPPEIRLVFMLASSGFMFNMTNTLFKTSLPGLDQVLKQNPDLMRQFAGATANMMATGGNDKTGLASMFSGMFGNGNPQANQPQQPLPRPMSSKPAPQPATMRGPSNMNHILEELGNNDRMENMSNITASEISDITEVDSTHSGVILQKKGGRRSMVI